MGCGKIWSSCRKTWTRLWTRRTTRRPDGPSWRTCANTKILLKATLPDTIPKGIKRRITHRGYPLNPTPANWPVRPRRSQPNARISVEELGGSSVRARTREACFERCVPPILGFDDMKEVYDVIDNNFIYESWLREQMSLHHSNGSASEDFWGDSATYFRACCDAGTGDSRYGCW